MLSEKEGEELMPIYPQFEPSEDPLDGISFSDESRNIYPVYTCIEHLYLPLSKAELKEATLSIGKKDFRVRDYPDAFTSDAKGTYLNLSRLLGITSRIDSQVLSLLITLKKKVFSVNYVYLNRFQLIKDPRKKENEGKITLLLDSLVLDFPYQRKGLDSSLKINIHGIRLALLLDPEKK